MAQLSASMRVHPADDLDFRPEEAKHLRLLKPRGDGAGDLSRQAAFVEKGRDDGDREEKQKQARDQDAAIRERGQHLGRLCAGFGIEEQQGDQDGHGPPTGRDRHRLLR